MPAGCPLLTPRRPVNAAESAGGELPQDRASSSPAVHGLLAARSSKAQVAGCTHTATCRAVASTPMRVVSVLGAPLRPTCACKAITCAATIAATAHFGAIGGTLIR